MSSRADTKVVEMRRHSARHHDQWGHLTQAGVEFAQRAGATMGRFDLVVSSQLPRAADTAIAMGYGIDREIEDLAVVGPAAMEEIDWPMGFAAFAHRMKPGTALERRGMELAVLLQSLTHDLPDGGIALALSHCAVIEMATIASIPRANHTGWGPQCGHCEGVRFTYQTDRPATAEILRIDGATGR